MSAARALTRTMLLLAVAAGALPACRSDSTPGGATADADFLSCDTETRATPYQAGMQVTSSAGTYVVKLLSNTFTDATGKVIEEAPARGIDVWTVEADSAATLTPIDGLMISVSPYMPDHRHGTTAAGVTPIGSGSGRYTIAPLNLYMAGYWEITLTITAPSTDPDASTGTGVSDTAMLPICVPG